MVEMQAAPSMAKGATLERLLYTGVVTVAVAVRILGLGSAPLTPVEANNVWPAWLTATGQTAPALATPDSPLMYSLHLLFLWLAPGGEAWVRLPAVFAGVALAALPWLIRAQIGRGSALILALLLALDPWLVFFSRFADGAILSLFLAALAMVALTRARTAAAVADTVDWWRWLQLAAVATGLLLVSGLLAWPLLTVVGINLVVLGLPRSGANRLPAVHSPFSLLVLGGVAALLGSTAWLAQPHAISLVGVSLDWWFNASHGVYSMAWLGVRILVEQPLAVVFGPIGLAMLIRTRPTRRSALFLLTWLLLATLLLALPVREPRLLLLWHMPLLVGAAVALSRLADPPPGEIVWGEALPVIAAVLALVFSASFWLRAIGIAIDLDWTALSIIVLLIPSILLVLAVYAAWTGWRAARWVGSIVLFAILLTASLAAMWHLAHENDPMHPDGFFATASHPDLWNLAADLATLSALRTGDEGELPVQSQMTVGADPLLAWYLRELRWVEWVLAPDVTLTIRGRRPALVTSTETTLAADSAYLGSIYRTHTSWTPDALLTGATDAATTAERPGMRNRLQDQVQRFWRNRGRSLVRWVLYRETSQIPQAAGVTLWVAPQQE